MSPNSASRTLHQPDFERDSCGFGLVARLDRQPSREVVEDALAALNRLTHRGAVAPDGKTGDGCGVLIRKPVEFLVKVAEEAGIAVGSQFAVGTLFLDPNDAAGAQRKRMHDELAATGLQIAGWRPVPIDPDACGEPALRTLPRIEQIFVNAPFEMEVADFERRLYLARRRCELATAADERFYVASLSSQTLSYKGMVMPEYLASFYPDLRHPLMKASAVVFHQRFSTNTLPRWELAQPFRVLAHNGEINTIRGNRNWTRARRALLASPLLPELAELDPPVAMHGSDSSSLDNMLELLMIGG
ncbi:MAG: glutamate synthase large subunit, partial [Cycloclasticus sp.]|nr:glutamate synthase large subunit [Cycloclasticus sp.]